MAGWTRLTVGDSGCSLAAPAAEFACSIETLGSNGPFDTLDLTVAGSRASTTSGRRHKPHKPGPDGRASTTIVTLFGVLQLLLMTFILSPGAARR